MSTVKEECNHTKFVEGHWEPYNNPNDNRDYQDDWIPSYDEPTTRDVDVHTFECTQCGKRFGYS